MSKRPRSKSTKKTTSNKKTTSKKYRKEEPIELSDDEEQIVITNLDSIICEPKRAPTLTTFPGTTTKQVSLSSDGLEVSCNVYYSWTTVKGTVTVYKGNWYYEVNLKSYQTGLRIGWCSNNFNPQNQIISDDNSWLFDGSTKHHKGQQDSVNNSTHWNKGDTIGTLIDFDQRKISYYHNGREMEITFNNIRDVGMIPLISVSYETKIRANFGPFFKFQPLACTGMNSTLTQKQKKDLENVFEKYRKLEESEEECIKGAGTIELMNDFGSNGVTDPLIALLAWKLHSKSNWEFHKPEWLCYWALYQSFTFSQMKSTVTRWREELKDDNAYRGLYNFLFEYLKSDKKATALEKSEAIMAWKLVGFDKRWSLFDKWEKWWESNSLKGVTKDTWVMLIRFIDKVNDVDSLDSFDESDCWPTAIDDFVIEVLKKDSEK